MTDRWGIPPLPSPRPRRKTISLTQPEKGVLRYVADLPDGRKLEVIRTTHNVFKMLRNGAVMVRAAPTWALAVVDAEAQVASEAIGFHTRADAVDAAIRWVDENPRGTVVPSEA